MNRLLPCLLPLLLLAVPALASPKDVRRVLKEHGFIPEQVWGEIVAYPEPSMTTRLVGEAPKEMAVTEFDPLPTVSKKLTKKQSAELAGILADPRTYSPYMGGKLCGMFHADVAIRIPDDAGGAGSAYLLLCFTCNQIRVIQHTQGLGFADIDRGRNRLLLFLRAVFPQDKRIQELKLYTVKDHHEPSVREQLDYAREVIPDDPLVKQLLARKPEEVSEEDLEEIDSRCMAEEERYRREGPTEAQKEREKQRPKSGIPGLAP